MNATGWRTLTALGAEHCVNRIGCNLTKSLATLPLAILGGTYITDCMECTIQHSTMNLERRWSDANAFTFHNVDVVLAFPMSVRKPEMMGWGTVGHSVTQIDTA